MNRLHPKITFASLPAMLGCAALGAVLAGLYGVVHDELTYSISPEYFTRMKFAQRAATGLPPRQNLLVYLTRAVWEVQSSTAASREAACSRIGQATPSFRMAGMPNWSPLVP